MRELTSDDAEGVYLLNLDPEVIKYTYDPPFKSIDEARTFIQDYDHYQRFGFGRWAVISKADESFLGWCGLKYTEDSNEYDIGFRFFKKYWNRGFATESAKASIALGFSKYGLSTILGRAINENTASIRVLEKIGLTFYKSFEIDGHEGVIYKIEKQRQKSSE